MKKRHVQPGECPDQCNGKSPTRQIELSRSVLDRLPQAAQHRIVELGLPRRCSYCGCVYVKTEKIGFWNNAILGDGWHSRYFPLGS